MLNNLKGILIDFLSAHQYPQIIFANQIKKLIERSGFKGGVILDVPCGNGETSYFLSKLRNTMVMAYDISEKSVAFANGRYGRSNLKFTQGDIGAILKSFQTKVNAICVINSLFLLENREDILKSAKTCLVEEGHLILIVPNINGINYINFKKINPSVNLCEMNSVQVRKEIEQAGFRVNSIAPICFAHFYGRRELRYLSILAPFYLRAINYLMSLFKFTSPAYYLIHAQKF
jgi:SAM-dependent methyltransferase